MNDKVINDLKEFITTTVSQQTSDIDERFEKVRDDINKLDIKLSGKIDNVTNSVADAMANTNDDTDARLKDHEERILQLEQNTV